MTNVQGSSAGCGCRASMTASGSSRADGRSGAGLVALACGLAWLAAIVPLLWPVATLAAALGAYRLVRAAGCMPHPKADPSLDAPPLARTARRRRARTGLGFLAIAGALAMASWRVTAALWPLALLGGWFGVSFLVAAATAYPGCPEVGAIASLALGRRIETRCPPLDRDAEVRRP
jgi:hypothetical protein